MIIALAYLAAVTAAELVTSLVSPLGGIVFHIAILVTLVIHATVATGSSQRRFFLALALAPLIRLLSLTMPLNLFPQIYWYAIIALPLLTATFLVSRRLGFRLSEIGFTFNNRRAQLATALVGLPLGVVEYFILKPTPLIQGMTPGGLLLPAFILLVGTGFTEEVTFRGVLQRSAGETLGRWGLIYVAVLFAVMHIGYLSVVDVAFVFGVGLLFGWIVKKTGSIFGVTLAHGLANITLYLVFPFLV